MLAQDLPAVEKGDTLSEASQDDEDDSWLDEELPVATKWVKRSGCDSVSLLDMAGGHTSTVVTSGGVRSVASSGSVPGDAQLPPYVSSPAGAGVWIVEDEKAFAILVREYPGQKVQFNMQVRCVCVCVYY